MRLLAATVGVVLAMAASPAAGWSASSFDVALDIGAMTGDSTYQIGGLVTDNLGFAYELQWPLSELKWPLDAVVASVGARAGFGRLSLRGRIGANLTDDPGEMEDSDWGVYYLESGGNPHFSDSSLDIFSTSDATMDAMVVDLTVRWDFLDRPGFSLAGGVGVLYQEFSFEARGVDQYSPTWQDYGLPYDRHRYRGGPSELAIKYDVTYIVPYLEIAAGWRLGARVAVDASLGFSPYTSAQDTDDHVLRGKLSEGSCEGTAVMANVEAKMAFGRTFFGAAGVNFLAIDTEGTQEQSYYPGPNTDPDAIGYEATIDQAITSTQASLYLRAGFAF